MAELGGADRAAQDRVNAALRDGRGPDIGPYLAAAWKTERSPAQRAGLLQVLADRRERALVAIALEAAFVEDPQVRAAGLRALRVLAGPDEVPYLLALLGKPREDKDRKGIQVP